MKNKNRFAPLIAVTLFFSFILLLLLLHQGVGMRAAKETKAASVSQATTISRDERLWREAQRIHGKAIIVDGHNDITTAMTNHDYDLEGPPPVPYTTNIERMRRGGLTAEFFSIYVKRWYATNGGASRRAMDMVDAVYRAVERHPNDLMMATSVVDIRHAKRQEKIAALMGIEGGHVIENSLGVLRDFYRLGVRYMTLTWNNTNDWADAGRGEQRHNGLTDFGREVVREMNRLGMLVDVSHVSDKTMSDALDVSRAPLIASHSSARALANQPRNIPDELLRRIARNGGIVMVNFYTAFLDPKAIAATAERSSRLKEQSTQLEERFKNDPERLGEEQDKLDAAHPLPPTPLSILIDHIDHIVKVAGIDHVGLGSDFDGTMDLPEEMKDVSMLPNITYELLRRGYSAQDIRKILGENFLRVFARAEAVARSSGRTISGAGSTRRINRTQK